MSKKPKKQLAQQDKCIVEILGSQQYIIDTYNKIQDYYKESKTHIQSRDIPPESESRMLEIFKASDYEIDKYGLPTNISLSIYFESLVNSISDYKQSKIELIEDMKSNNEDINQYPILVDDDFVDFEHMTVMLDEIGIFYGKFVQNLVAPTRKGLQKALLPTSKKKGKKYFKPYHWDLMDDLQCYWDGNELKNWKFPIDPSTNQPYYVRTYFEYLADKYDVSPKNIEAFAGNNDPKKTRK